MDFITVSNALTAARIKHRVLISDDELMYGDSIEIGKHVSVYVERGMACVSRSESDGAYFFPLRRNAVLLLADVRSALSQGNRT